MKITKKSKPSMLAPYRALLHYMNEHAEGDLFTQPQQMIADELGVGRSTVSRLEKWLVKAKHIIIHEPAVCMESKPAVYRVCTPCPPQSTPCPNGQIKDSIDSVIVRKTDSLGILESVGKPTPVHHKSGGGVNRLEPATATKLFNIKGVGLVGGTSYEDAEKKVKEKRESYLEKKGGL